ncbi:MULTISPECIES: polysaccharide deacetylase family protein [Chryseobacterium]|uniref:Peptidoglycan/xylan/chitin deacetylase (PgdA/CDA1 family) n=1 Tax=Chryseobacterium camelliae TaxID=1265445 RepID=A0ABU0TLR0_9FLAO|nr:MULTISPECIES: polysaccharide deacetylase family protein [Chryseobacterium]MDT3408220.1 peptidoglycan/xylan/chitin deacetylase (PgdA/CDA1 family) [Pseudacidovorax intermedius]MDQ1097926.1 peptidoglycan/xylan/chitin deacetylase (PgdA/CDA1 family) [Chryseobacterium camelliae]MDQ1101857.1 peptidoglycan/xylan/chitin deacetylase (PgdA/CDA1 family) [Chryseobacterium sp. SORGH_AS_1048]MDR6085297.1 peptidoglycan/xylan/chitin deacetylase (PgdA/CDA1 family) [Chryseobacterium sp. SORGH_AS_0909]MDR61296
MKHYLFILFYLFCNLFIYGFKGGFWVYVFCFIWFSAVVIWASFDIRLGYFVNSITHKRTKKKEIALTFDDGPTEFTQVVLDLLHEHQLKATFFCIGKQVEKYPEIFRRIISEGHTIGNHTYSHSKSTGFLSAAAMTEEIKHCDAAMVRTGNIKTPLYRPPFGVTNPNIAKAIKRTGKKSIGWNVRSLDTVTEHAPAIYRRIVKRIRPGSIVLLHDTSEKTTLVLKDLLLFLKDKKYNTYTIDSLIKPEYHD